jgi:NAD(P)-dependent dehydrogenase (short-subunit alcohol dehydrogenase family)
MTVAIVTGASKGIGRAVALRLAADGMSVVLAARNQAALDETALAIGSKGGQAAAIALDLRVPASPRRVVDFTLQKFGRIDVVVNNAGATKRGDFIALTDEDWSDGFALKFFGAVRLTRVAWPHLKISCGSVVHISGIGGRTPGREFTIGGSVNAALLSFTKALADQGIVDGVQVNAINPGLVRTDRLKARLAHSTEAELLAQAGATRIGEPEDIASLVAYVVSPAARFIHGALIDIDGGQTKTI